MKRILHMTPPIVNNGVYKYIFSNLKYIDKSKYEFAFLTQARSDLEATEEYKEYGFQIHNFTTTQRENPQKFRQEIIDILSMDYDVLQLHTSFWRGFLIEEIAMEIGMSKVIVHSHSSDIDIANSKKRDQMYQEHLKFKSMFSTEYATDFWACSRKAADWLYGDNIPVKKIKIMRNAIEVDKYIFDEEVRTYYRKKLGLENKFVIGNTCRFEYQKNHEFLVRVFAKIHVLYPETVLLLVGGGQGVSQIKKLVREYGLEKGVLFLGWRNDIPQILQAMDLYCLPSRFEGLPIVLVEAQAAGLACLTSDTVTEEVKITSDIHYISLEEDKWVKRIEGYIKGYDRCNTSKCLREAGFDIRDQIKVIEAEYSK